MMRKITPKNSDHSKIKTVTKYPVYDVYLLNIFMQLKCIFEIRSLIFIITSCC